MVLGSLDLKYPSWYLSTTYGCGTTCSSSVPLCPSYLSQWMWFLIPWLLGIKPYSSIFSIQGDSWFFCCLVVICAVVVWGGKSGSKPCFPMPLYCNFLSPMIFWILQFSVYWLKKEAGHDIARWLFKGQHNLLCNLTSIKKYSVLK